MPTASHSISQLIQELASQANLTVVSAGAGTDFTGAPTAKLQLKSPSGTTYSVETSEGLSAEIEKRPALGDELKTYLHTLARRMQSARPDVFLTLHGIPLSLQQFSWPYHRSTSGADSYILHGIAQLAEAGSPLHAKVAASLTVTFAEVLPALEQPYAEGVTFNALRKTLDLGQLELLKSGNRQPVPVSTRYYSSRQQRFIFSETDETKRKEFVRAKVFWATARLGEGKPSWIADPYDAQYLDCSTEDLGKIARELANEGLLTLDSSREFAVASAKLSSQADQFVKRMESALALLKPKFNEEMRAGHTNM
ncbi:MAG TPA: hypothetical protein VNX88_15565 [Terriglobales bacterium]|nr:hypothetical protein [Terriglobales bacterium]